MKPVQLRSKSAKNTKVAVETKTNPTVVGGIAFGVIGVFVVAGYFAMATVDSTKSEASKFRSDAEQARTETASIQSQIDSLGKPIVDSDRQIAQGAEQMLTASFAEQKDVVRLSREIAEAFEGTKGWLTMLSVTTVSGASGSVPGIELEGYMPTSELAASMKNRINAGRTMHKADIVSIEEEVRFMNETGEKEHYFKFSLVAEIVDPAGGDSSASTDPAGTAVASGGNSAGGSELTLALSASPPLNNTAKKKTTTNTTAKKSSGNTGTLAANTAPEPQNPLAVAANKAGGSN